MNENLNLVEILKDCPKGTKLYSSVFGEVEFDHINTHTNYTIVIRLKDRKGYESLTSEGKMFAEYYGECILFPSRENRDWSKFTAPWYIKERDTIDWLEKQGEQNLPSANERAWLYLVSDVLTWKDGIGQYLDDPRVQELAKRLCSKYAQKLYNSSILSNSSNTGKNEQKYANKNKPMFDVGVWVVFITSESVYKVEKKENYEYTLRHILGGSLCLPFSNEKLIREWTIQDAKDGDVICYRDEISLYKHDIKNCTKQETTFGGFVYYCCYDGKRFITDSLYMLTKQDEIDIHPATKEQRDALMKAMNDAGYEWDDDTKTLKKLVKPKFDPKTLQPFDKVLARNTENSTWRGTLFSYYNKDDRVSYPCVTVGYVFSVCIPYNDETKHLLGTRDEAPEYYRYWED